MSSVDLEGLSPFFRENTLVHGQVLCEAGELDADVYFPCRAVIVARRDHAEDGRSVEIASVGYENAAGLLPALSRVPGRNRMFVQIAGGAISIPADKLRAQSSRSPILMGLILRFAQARVAQSDQAGACRASHALSGRLAYWLLTCADRVDRLVMSLTQDDMAVMTGALRSSISLVASDFKRAGLINYSRGELEILDLPGLIARACPCYDADTPYCFLAPAA